MVGQLLEARLVVLSVRPVRSFQIAKPSGVTHWLLERQLVQPKLDFEQLISQSVFFRTLPFQSPRLENQFSDSGFIFSKSNDSDLFDVAKLKLSLAGRHHETSQLLFPPFC